MQQRENISELLKRYILDECSEEDIEKVIAYFSNSTNSKDVPSVEEVLHLLKEYEKLGDTTSDLSFSQVLKIAKEKDSKTYSKTTRKGPWFKYASIAALFIGVVASGYFFQQNRISDDPIAIPTDAITLELEDGSIQILGEVDSKQVIAKNGKIIGQQTGSQISYEKISSIEELVYNTLTVPYGKRFDLKLSDGTMVHLNAGTSLKYPVKFLDGQTRKIFLNGEAFFDVSKDSLNPFVVNADELDISVLGTRFNVSSYPEDARIDVVLVEGSVKLKGKTEAADKNTNTILEPGFIGTFEKRNKKIETQAVITDIYTAWIDGELVFRNMTFENILKKLERHYDVSIVNNNKALAHEVFNASYGQVSLKKVLEDLKLTHSIDYLIEETNIIIN